MQSVVFRNARIPLGGNLLGGNAKGYVYVCSTCGEAWGRVEISGFGNYIVSSWPCENHGNTFNRGGSFLHRVSWLDFSTERNLANSLAKSSDEFLSHEMKMLINQRLEK